MGTTARRKQRLKRRPGQSCRALAWTAPSMSGRQASPPKTPGQLDHEPRFSQCTSPTCFVLVSFDRACRSLRPLGAGVHFRALLVKYLVDTRHRRLAPTPHSVVEWLLCEDFVLLAESRVIQLAGRAPGVPFSSRRTGADSLGTRNTGTRGFSSARTALAIPSEAGSCARASHWRSCLAASSGVGP